MNKEEFIQLCKEEFLKNIKEFIKSETIFTYVDNLEKENKKQKEVLDKIKEIINNVISNGEVIDQLRKIEVKEILDLLEEIE